MKKFLLPLIAFYINTVLVQSCKTTSSNSTGKTLKFNFQKGKGYNYEMISDLNMNLMGMDTKVYVDGQYSMQVTDDDGQTKTISMIYKSMNMQTNAMGMDINIDTDKPAIVDTGNHNPFAHFSGIMSKILSIMINKPFMMKVNSKGEILELEGVDKMMGGLADSLKLDSMVKMQVVSSLKKQFGDDNIRNSFSELLTIFPNKEIKVGDSWVKTYTQKLGEVPEKNTTTFTVKQIDGDAITLDADTKIEVVDGKPEMSVEGRKKAIMLVDSKSGLIINNDFTLDIKIKNAVMDMRITGKGKVKGTAL
jgi:hypothetical protein